MPEPEKNEILRPVLENTTEDIPDIAESIKIESSIPKEKFTNYHKRQTNEETYHQRVEARINDLITKLEAKEIKLSDLNKQDQDVIMSILNEKNE